MGISNLESNNKIMYRFWGLKDVWVTVCLSFTLKKNKKKVTYTIDPFCVFFGQNNITGTFKAGQPMPPPP